MVLQRQEVQRRLPIQRNTQGRAAANASFGVDDPCVDPIFRRVGVARAGTVDERDRSDAVGVGALQIEPAGSRRNNRGDGAPALAAAASTPATAPAPTDRAAPAALVGACLHAGRGSIVQRNASRRTANVRSCALDHPKHKRHYKKAHGFPFPLPPSTVTMGLKKSKYRILKAGDEKAA